MTVFGHYSSYYDLLYKDKNYSAEAEYVKNLLIQHRPLSRHILELGCGSGGHAFELAKRGFELHGVDLSATMLDMARSQLTKQSDEIRSLIRFYQSDVRHFRAQRKFDCVISLFHVMSYLPTLPDIRVAFANANHHLEHNGIFLFDVWYAPAVLTDRPEVRVKRMSNSDIAVTRIAEPVWHPNECWVDVHYNVFVRDLKTGRVEELEKEIHRMRYLSLPEIELLAALSGFTIVHSSEWLTQNPPSEKSWGVCFVLKKVAEAN